MEYCSRRGCGREWEEESEEEEEEGDEGTAQKEDSDKVPISENSSSSSAFASSTNVLTISSPFLRVNDEEVEVLKRPHTVLMNPPFGTKIKVIPFLITSILGSHLQSFLVCSSQKGIGYCILTERNSSLFICCIFHAQDIHTGGGIRGREIAIDEE